MEEAESDEDHRHTTNHVFRHYDIGDVEALRDRLARAREQTRARPSQPSVIPIRAQS